jgi:hypothetical protein
MQKDQGEGFVLKIGRSVVRSGSLPVVLAGQVRLDGVVVDQPVFSSAHVAIREIHFVIRVPDRGHITLEPTGPLFIFLIAKSFKIYVRKYLLGQIIRFYNWL